MNHHATPDFWKLYQQLPLEIQTLASKNFELLKQNSRHPSLKLKKINEYWTARVGLKYQGYVKIQLISRQTEAQPKVL